MTAPRLTPSLTPIAATTTAGKTHECGADGELTHGVRKVLVTVFCECGCAWRSSDATIAFAQAESHVKRQAAL